MQIIQLDKVDYLQINLLNHTMFIQIALLQFKRKYYFTYEKKSPLFSLRHLEGIIIRILEKGWSFKTAKYQLWSILLNLKICYAKILMWENKLHKIASGIYEESQMPLKVCKANVVCIVKAFSVFGRDMRQLFPDVIKMSAMAYTVLNVHFLVKI